MIFEEKQKSQPIEKRQVMEAFKKVKSNKGASGVDGLSILEVSASPMTSTYIPYGIDWQVAVIFQNQYVR